MAKNIATNIAHSISSFVLGKISNNSLYNEYYKRSSGSKAQWNKQSTMHKAQKIDEWIQAVMTATDPNNPRRGDLMRFYTNIATDMHLSACVENRILPVQCAPFKLVNSDGVEDAEAHKLLEKPWFMDFAKIVCNAAFQGTTLIELFELNEKGEVKEVEEIPQSNFIAHKGIILKDEYDDNGALYKEGRSKDFYIQVGKNFDLGLYCKVAVIVLAKKLGMGSWMGWIEKFGVPPLFAITDRLDDARQKELFEMLENFKQNHFAVLQGNEKIEIPSNYQIDAHNAFKSLAEICDSYLTKYLNGGTGVTDEKSFVGSTQLHEKLLIYRQQVDKLLFKFYINEELFPRLVKLSSVYAPLANLRFEFDESETLTLKEILEAVKILSAYYDFNVEELVKITGLPILKIKETVAAGALENNKKQTGEKKKPNAKVNYELYANLNAATWDKASERIAREVYSGKIKPVDLDNDLVLKQYAEFNKKAKEVWGKGYYDEEVTRKIRDDLMRFSAAKSYNLITKLHELKKGSDSEADFTTEAKKLIKRHNDTYHDTEMQQIASSVAAANDWKRFQEEKDIYPNVKYRTIGDDEVRDSHAKLEGTVFSLDDKVLATLATPNGDRCRCWLEQTLEEPSSVIPKIQIDERFRNNVGMTGEVFTKVNSYQQSVSKKDRALFHDNMNKMKKHTPYNRVIKTKGDNKVHVSDFSDIADLSQNIIAAKKLADNFKKDIYIRPHSNSYTGVKNPEFGIGEPNVFADLKTFTASTVIHKFIKNSITSASKQNCKYVVLDITDLKEINYVSIANKLRGELSNNNKPTIKNIVFIKGAKVGTIKRSDILGKKYLELIENMLKQQ